MMHKSVAMPFPPMEATSVPSIPEGEGWLYEPKWDGFRCLAFRDGDKVQLQSKAERPLERYFPDVVEAIQRLAPRQFVLDGEIAIPEGNRLSFDALLQRIHPAASRVARLARETPAIYIVFDLLVDPRGRSLVDRPLSQRRARLEDFAARYLSAGGVVRLSPATADLRQARRWFRAVGGSLDGIVAKRLAMSYQSGNREGMVKIKPAKTADCVVGGFRYLRARRELGSLLLGLYGDDGLLHHVGFTASFPASRRKELMAKLEPLIGPPGFTGRAPGGPSRWSAGRSTEWTPLVPKLVVEVAYDQFSSGRFRHGTNFLRWRPDKAPRQCTFEQLAQAGSASLRLLKRARR